MKAIRAMVATRCLQKLEKISLRCTFSCVEIPNLAPLRAHFLLNGEWLVAVWFGKLT